MSSNLDRSLDDIVQSTRRPRQPRQQQQQQPRRAVTNNNNRQTQARRLPVRNNNVNNNRQAPRLPLRNTNSNNNNSTNNHNNNTNTNNNAPRQRQQVLEAAESVFVSNLDPSITENDLNKQIFSSIGLVKSVTVNCDRQGRSQGTATVVFASAAQAKRAVEEFEGAKINNRVMHVKIISNVVTAPAPLRVEKKAVAPAVRRAPVSNNNNNNRNNNVNNQRRQQAPAPRTTRRNVAQQSQPRARGPAGAPGRRNANRNNGLGAISTAQLDADLDRYNAGRV